MADYKLVPAEIPSISKATVYSRVMEDFTSGKDKSVRVDIPKRKPSTVHQGLLKTKRMNPQKFGMVRVVRRGVEVYLAK